MSKETQAPNNLHQEVETFRATVKERRKKACRAFIRRAITFTVFDIVIGFFWILGWIIPGLAAFLIGMSCAFFAIWFGAWMQYTLAGRGLLYVKLS